MSENKFSVAVPNLSTPATAPAASNNVAVTLKHTVVVDGSTYTSLTLRRPKVRDLLHAAKQGGTAAEQEVLQFASLAGVPPKVIEELDVADYLAVQKQVQAFLS